MTEQVGDIKAGLKGSGVISEAAAAIRDGKLKVSLVDKEVKNNEK